MFKHMFYIIFTLLISHLVGLQGKGSVTPSDQADLERAHRNAECCAKKMRCCLRLQGPPIEIRAVIARCPNLGTHSIHTHISRTMPRPVMATNEYHIKSFQGFDEDEPLIQSRVTECRNKIIMTMKLHHHGNIICKSQYIVVDHVYDPITDKSVRLLNPYVIRLRQEPVSRSFHLKFVDYVNSEAREEVFNKQRSNYTGCYTSRHRSTCGTVKFDGKVIPYSEGFCCSCDSKKNLQRQPDSLSDKNEEIISYSDPAYLLDRVGCPRDYFSEVGMDQVVNGNDVINCTSRNPETKHSAELVQYATDAVEDNHKRADLGQGNRWKYSTYAYGNGNITKKNTFQSESTYHPYYLKRETTQKSDDNLDQKANVYFKKLSTVATKKFHKNQYMADVKKAHNSAPYLHPGDEARNSFETRLSRKIRQTFPSGVQKRGGQNCADRYTPPGLDPDHYHESTHCLRFSDVWYGIYKLGEPTVEQIVYINIYERFEAQSVTDKWREVTNGTIRLGNRYVHYEDELPSVSLTLTSKSMPDRENYDDWENKRILIPEGVRACEAHKYPEMRGGPDEYLVVPESKIALEGEQCDSIGVGFEAFYKQPQRCGLPRGTCLHNQPKHLWRNDKHLEQKGKMGCYFLKYHANITAQPIFVNETTGEKYLFVEFTGAHMTIMDIEIKADQNSVIRDIATAAITEVYVDSTCGKYTMITIKVINTGLISAKFMVQLSDFPLELPEYFSKIRSKLTLIPPQALHIFNLEIKQSLPSDLMYCSVEVVNKKDELVALRRVRIQKFDRCICAWYCLCACVASLTGLKCNPMSLEHYHAAGFDGALPIVTYMVHFSMLDDLLSVAFYFILFLLGMLLLLGLFKAIVGLCFFRIGMWGLSVVLDLPKPMKKYYERSLLKERVIYDDKGWPVNPKTFKKARNISIATAFCSNLVFFYTYPLACTVIIFRRLCFPYYTKRVCPGISNSKHRQHITCKCKENGKKRPCGDPNCVRKRCAASKTIKSKRKIKYAKSDTSYGDLHRGDKHAQTDQSSKSSRSSYKSDKSGKSNKSTKSHHKAKTECACFAMHKNQSPFLQAPIKTDYEDNASPTTTYGSITNVKKPSRKLQESILSCVTFEKTALPSEAKGRMISEEIAAVTTSSDYSSSSRSISPRAVHAHYGAVPKRTTDTTYELTRPLCIQSESSRTSATSQDNTSSVTSRSLSTSFQTTETTDSVDAESVAVQTRVEDNVATTRSLAEEEQADVTYCNDDVKGPAKERPKSM